MERMGRTRAESDATERRRNESQVFQLNSFKLFKIQSNSFLNFNVSK